MIFVYIHIDIYMHTGSQSHMIYVCTYICMYIHTEPRFYMRYVYTYICTYIDTESKFHIHLGRAQYTSLDTSVLMQDAPSDVTLCGMSLRPTGHIDFGVQGLGFVV